MTEFIDEALNTLVDIERIPYAVVALLLSALIGGVTGAMNGNAYPFIYWGVDKLLGGLGDRLDRLKRSVAELVFRGFILLAAVLLLGIFAGQALQNHLVHEPSYGIPEILVLCTLISTGAVWSTILRLYTALEASKDKRPPQKRGAFYAIARSMRLNLSQSDDAAITRAGLNFTARSFDKALVAPIFWYIIGGIGFALLYSLVSALVWRFGKDGFSKGFGAAALALERALGFVPSIIAAMLLTLATVFAPTAKPAQAVKAWFGIKNRAPYACGGLPVSVSAWALNLIIGGPFQDISGSALNGEWVGPDGATARNDDGHLRRALILNIVAHIIFVAALCALYLFSA